MAAEWLYWQEHVECEAYHQAITTEEREQHDLMAHAYLQLRLWTRG